MIFAYTARLLCLCLASFCVVNALTGLQVILFTSKAIRFAEKFPARTGARILFVFRVLPFLLSACAVLFLCLPSYLKFEPRFGPEGMGPGSVVLAVPGLMVLSLAAFRGIRSLVQSVRINRDLTAGSSYRQQVDESVLATVLPNQGPLLAVVGILRPRLMISEGVQSSLNAEQLRLALKHESAHRNSSDNVKRLILQLTPDPVPFLRRFAAIDEAWARLSEWAADDAAVGNNSECAVTLAAALLRVARMGNAPRLSYLHTSLVSGSRDLAARVERLLNLEVVQPQRKICTLLPPIVTAALLCSVSCVVIFGMPILAAVHKFSEEVLH
jgi:beta-lactamase regulating signal transducer with metallopeptidase domain